ncbi:MAG TPA: sigma-54-dependent Fis family transcriptional regulator [Algoriphagus sp.]|jgi:transcriptional regulator with PAS, ATPase and Fis domain|uniref:sigma-54 interaction domain-containing protein n=1 Tax=unclassified Algoriphagus TaxID=2641541 RepID=UPI000C3FE57C|nr:MULTISPECIES: sigma-54 dependent transcriptional regulator [unclassified Algoriphagus]MAL12867.1 sigma-54-dependent Fis family transcriptional regulator [Algoriphagus sp.]QYH39140.1 sigma-54-dependent Fis family transcriptional regulator [Algoriphagus sp. NBT04N3]HAD49991.1 sigma-54-dependent Fis family transcriptional regulator [Algoriphagus sp.]HCD86976.1 sigma-54-dependent Fis family transcriptional regulator [Algoriphagus sp.]|tara:strand:- start:20975 stop:22270 length:1296 start_codon:yes stop_codon:yes gene_type:complete
MITAQEIHSVKLRFGIIGNSPLLNHAIQVAMQAAPTDMTVLITGESGSGKESFSKIIHSISTRKHGKFIAINCGAIPEGTIDSELFGHEKGSFTGAHEARKGYFEVTDGGSIFLDEIGEMPLGTQARLLRVLENGEFIKVGSSKVQKTNVRVITATNVNLLKAVEKGKFREDLYYRLNTVPIYVPPLRERGEDVVLLFRKFTSDFSEKYHVKPISLDEQAQTLLMRYPFPGNIRQLKNIAEQISLLEEQREVDAETLSRYLPAENSRLPMTLPNNQGKSEGMDFSERDILYKVLFDMKKDMNELKKLVLESYQSGGLNQSIIQKHSGLFEDMESNLAPAENKSDNSPNYNVPLVLESQKPSSVDTDEYEDEAIEDIIHEEDDNSLSLEKKEKEMILRALRKHNNKRKYAASDLGISERTLYRKIKQYEIDQ